MDVIYNVAVFRVHLVLPAQRGKWYVKYFCNSNPLFFEGSRCIVLTRVVFRGAVVTDIKAREETRYASLTEVVVYALSEIHSPSSPHLKII